MGEEIQMSEVLFSTHRARRVPWFALIAISLVVALSAAIAVSLSTRTTSNAPVRGPAQTSSVSAPDSCAHWVRGVC